MNPAFGGNRMPALSYSLTAQLQGSGDIHCSVTVAGNTKKGHASGGDNICNA
ncbi:hypothetical protein [Streptomyces sp. NPDC055109]